MTQRWEGSRLRSPFGKGSEVLFGETWTYTYDEELVNVVRQP